LRVTGSSLDCPPDALCACFGAEPMPSHTISVLVENEFGVLARVAGLFSGRGYNIESLTVNEDPIDPTVSRIVLVTSGDDQVLEQVNKQLNKLVSVIKILDFKDVETVDRELVMVRVAVDDRTRSEFDSIVSAFRGRVVDIGPRSMTVELTGDREKIKGFINLLRPLGIKEIVRSGKIAMARSVQLNGGARRAKEISP
jgi:acetolactate synthase-1/3 small subunit